MSSEENKIVHMNIVADDSSLAARVRGREGYDGDKTGTVYMNDIMASAN